MKGHFEVDDDDNFDGESSPYKRSLNGVERLEVSKEREQGAFEGFLSF